MFKTVTQQENEFNKKWMETHAVILVWFYTFIAGGGGELVSFKESLYTFCKTDHVVILQAVLDKLPVLLNYLIILIVWKYSQCFLILDCHVLAKERLSVIVNHSLIQNKRRHQIQ